MKKITVGTNTLMIMAKQLLDKGEITQEQYIKMQERNSTLPKNVRYDEVELT